jgi:hypothetical protein
MFQGLELGLNSLPFSTEPALLHRSPSAGSGIAGVVIGRQILGVGLTPYSIGRKPLLSMRCVEAGICTPLSLPLLRGTVVFLVGNPPTCLASTVPVDVLGGALVPPLAGWYAVFGQRRLLVDYLTPIPLPSTARTVGLGIRHEESDRPASGADIRITSWFVNMRHKEG